jgi:hypothetical protein
MPAKSKSQQRFFGLVKAMQKGEVPKEGEAGKVAKSMTKKDVDDFASTKHKNKPEKVKQENNVSKVNKLIKKMVREAEGDGFSLDNIKNWIQSTFPETSAAVKDKLTKDYIKKQMTDPKNLAIGGLGVGALALAKSNKNKKEKEDKVEENKISYLNTILNENTNQMTEFVNPLTVLGTLGGGYLASKAHGGKYMPDALKTATYTGVGDGKTKPIGMKQLTDYYMAMYGGDKGAADVMSKTVKQLGLKPSDFDKYAGKVAAGSVLGGVVGKKLDKMRKKKKKEKEEQVSEDGVASKIMKSRNELGDAMIDFNQASQADILARLRGGSYPSMLQNRVDAYTNTPYSLDADNTEFNKKTRDVFVQSHMSNKNKQSSSPTSQTSMGNFTDKVPDWALPAAAGGAGLLALKAISDKKKKEKEEVQEDSLGDAFHKKIVAYQKKIEKEKERYERERQKQQEKQMQKMAKTQKNEGFAGALPASQRKAFNTMRKNQSEVLGYKLTGKSDVKVEVDDATQHQEGHRLSEYKKMMNIKK